MPVRRNRLRTAVQGSMRLESALLLTAGVDGEPHYIDGSSRQSHLTARRGYCTAHTECPGRWRDAHGLLARQSANVVTPASSHVGDVKDGAQRVRRAHLRRRYSCATCTRVLPRPVALRVTRQRRPGLATDFFATCSESGLGIKP